MQLIEEYGAELAIPASERRSRTALRASDGREVPSIAPAVDDHLHRYAPEPPRQYGLDHALAEPPPDAKGVADQHVRVETRAARVDSPPAIDRDLGGLDAPPFSARPIAVGERRV